ncbi:hypothetical protein ZWY2020_040230 [Hordeum vulgare]|nr:hypothetical protein ZWY2020_040230 [Hordeum vulgare]
MELSVDEEPRPGAPLELGFGEDAMEAVRRALPGQDFAIDVVNRAFCRLNPAERSQQDSSACGTSGECALEKPVELEQVENAGKRCAQQDPSASEVQLSSEEGEQAGQRCDAPPAPADVGGEAGWGWNRRVNQIRAGNRAAAASGERPENHTLEETTLNCLGIVSTTIDSANAPVDPLRYPEKDDTHWNAEAGRLADLLLAFGDCHLGPQFGGAVSAQVLTIKDLFRFTRWLTTTTGQHNLRCTQQRVKLVNSGKAVLEPEQIALLHLYQAENDEYSVKINKLQGERDAEIAHYMVKIDEARKSFEVSIEAAKEHYPVSASYVALDSNELRGQCWTMYLAQCRKEAKDLNAKASDIVEKYGPEIIQRHLFEFCSQETNREALLKYAQTKVNNLKEAGDARGENTLHDYMTLLDIEKAYALLAAEEQQPMAQSLVGAVRMRIM